MLAVPLLFDICRVVFFFVILRVHLLDTFEVKSLHAGGFASSSFASQETIHFATNFFSFVCSFVEINQQQKMCKSF